MGKFQSRFDLKQYSISTTAVILFDIFTDLVSRQSSAIGRVRPPVSTLSFEPYIYIGTYVKDYFVCKLLSGETYTRLNALSGPIKWAVNHKKILSSFKGVNTETSG